MHQKKVCGKQKTCMPLVSKISINQFKTKNYGNKI